MTGNAFYVRTVSKTETAPTRSKNSNNIYNLNNNYNFKNITVYNFIQKNNNISNLYKQQLHHEQQ